MHIDSSRPAVAALALAACTLITSTAGADDTPPVNRVRVDIDAPHLELHERTTLSTMVEVRRGRFGTALERSPVYAPLCASTPCEAAIAPGAHRLAMSTPGGAIVEADAPVVIAGPSTIHATYADRSGWRTAGWVTLTATTLGGLAMMLASRPLISSCSGAPSTGAACTPEPDGRLLFGGLGVILGGSLAALAMVLRTDAVSFSVTPLTLGAAPGRREAGAASTTPNGVAITARF